jgi:DNA-binding NtrC family response regulator
MHMEGKHMSKAALVVQDEPAVRRLIRIRLEQDGVRVMEALSARQALSIYTECADQIGVVVTGTRMAGLDGSELFDALRAADPEVPVLFFTSSPPTLDPLPPNVAVFGKPYGLGDLLRAVRELIPAA